MVQSVYMARKRDVRRHEVGVRDLRANLAHWLDEVKRGAEVIVTERGLPVARLLKDGQPTTMERLVAEGLVSLPKEPKTPITGPPIKTKGSVTELLLEMNRDDPY